ncbi:hypothetical protein ACIP86_05285 [Pseudomonas neuropathica]
MKNSRVAVGMGRSIRIRMVEKNRWWDKALLTGSHESFSEFVLSGLASSRAGSLPQEICGVHKILVEPAREGRTTDSGNVTVGKFLAEKINQRAHRRQ